MDDLDCLYDDLPYNLKQEDDEVKDTNENLESKSKCNECEKLQEKLEKLEAKTLKLEINISSLMKTARGEVDRKNRSINQLREQLNNVVFKRNNNQNRFNQQNLVTNDKCQSDYTHCQIPNDNKIEIEINQSANDTKLENHQFQNGSNDNFNTKNVDSVIKSENKRKYELFGTDDESENEISVEKKYVSTVYGERLQQKLKKEAELETKRKQEIEIERKKELDGLESNKKIEIVENNVSKLKIEESKKDKEIKIELKEEEEDEKKLEETKKKIENELKMLEKEGTEWRTKEPMENLRRKKENEMKWPTKLDSRRKDNNYRNNRYDDFEQRNDRHDRFRSRHDRFDHTENSDYRRDRSKSPLRRRARSNHRKSDYRGSRSRSNEKQKYWQNQRSHVKERSVSCDRVVINSLRNPIFYKQHKEIHDKNKENFNSHKFDSLYKLNQNLDRCKDTSKRHSTHNDKEKRDKIKSSSSEERRDNSKNTKHENHKTSSYNKRRSGSKEMEKREKSSSQTDKKKSNRGNSKDIEEHVSKKEEKLKTSSNEFRDASEKIEKLEKPQLVSNHKKQSSSVAVDNHKKASTSSTISTEKNEKRNDSVITEKQEFFKSSIQDTNNQKQTTETVVKEKCTEKLKSSNQPGTLENQEKLVSTGKFRIPKLKNREKSESPKKNRKRKIDSEKSVVDCKSNNNSEKNLEVSQVKKIKIDNDVKPEPILIEKNNLDSVKNNKEILNNDIMINKKEEKILLNQEIKNNNNNTTELLKIANEKTISSKSIDNTSIQESKQSLPNNRIVIRKRRRPIQFSDSPPVVVIDESGKKLW